MRVVHHWKKHLQLCYITAAIFEGKQFGSLSCKKSLKICNPLCRCTSTSPKNDPCETLPLFKKKLPKRQKETRSISDYLMKMASNDKKFWSFQNVLKADVSSWPLTYFKISFPKMEYYYGAPICCLLTWIFHSLILFNVGLVYPLIVCSRMFF